MKINPNAIKIRKTWQLKPVQKAHSSPKGKKGYKRSENKRIERGNGND